VNLLYFVLCSFGITQIIVYGKIFNSIRPTTGKLGELFSCTMCMGFWVGLFLWFVKDHTELFTFDNSPITAFLCGTISSATAYVLDVLFCDEGFKIYKPVRKRTINFLEK